MQGSNQIDKLGRAAATIERLVHDRGYFGRVRHNAMQLRKCQGVDGRLLRMIAAEKADQNGLLRWLGVEIECPNSACDRLRSSSDQ